MSHRNQVIEIMNNIKQNKCLNIVQIMFYINLGAIIDIAISSTEFPFFL